MTGSVLLCVGIMALYYGLCGAAFCAGGGGAILRRLTPRTLLGTALLCGGSLLFVGWAVGLNRTVYYWDLSAYWKLCLNQSHAIFAYPGEVLPKLLRSINEDDYNLLLPSVLALPNQLLGCSFAQYVRHNTLFFALPAFLVQGACAVKLGRHWLIKPNPAFLTGLAGAVFLPITYYAILVGYVDVGALLPGTVALFLLLDFDFTVRCPRGSLLMGLTLLLCWLCRRYWVYYILGYAAAIAVQAGWQWLHKRTAAALKNIFYNVLTAALPPLALLLGFFPGFVGRALHGSYASRYAGWNAPLRDKVFLLLVGFGLLGLAAVLLSLLWCIRLWKNFPCWVLLLVICAAESAAFFRVQAMGLHQIYILVPQAGALLSLSLMGGLASPRYRLHRALSAGCAALCLCSFLYVYRAAWGFSVRAEQQPSALGYAYRPLQRHDLPQLHKLVQDLDTLTAGTTDRIYVAASGWTLNGDLLSSIYLPKIDNALPALEITADADLRDGFPTRFLTARYVLVTTPPQLHLAEGTQEVVRIPCEEVQNPDSPVGRLYTHLMDYPLDSGVVARLYERTSPWSEEALNHLRETFAALYPGQDSLYAERITLPDGAR